MSMMPNRERRESRHDPEPTAGRVACGELSIESEGGVGTRVAFWLPAAVGAMPGDEVVLPSTALLRLEE